MERTTGEESQKNSSSQCAFDVSSEVVMSKVGHIIADCQMSSYGHIGAYRHEIAKFGYLTLVRSLR